MCFSLDCKRLSERCEISAREVIEKMAGVDVLCSDKAGTWTLNKLAVYRMGIIWGHGTTPVTLSRRKYILLIQRTSP